MFSRIGDQEGAISDPEQCRLVSKVVLTFETMWMKSYVMTIQVKPLQQYFHK